MRIALVGNDFLPQFPLRSYGGIEASVESLALALHKSGRDFCCIVPRRAARGSADAFEILETPCAPTSQSGRPAAEFASQAAAILRRRPADVVWSQGHWSLAPLLAVGVPVIASFHDSGPKQPGWMIDHPGVRYRFLSRFQRQCWALAGWERARSFHAHYGLGDDEFEFSAEDDGYFLWVAGLQWGWTTKGLDVFVELARRNPGRRFRAFGVGSRRIALRLRLLGLRFRNLEFAGELRRGPRHREAFARARALVAPTRLQESFGRTVIESLSKGTPVLAFSSGALPELIGEGTGVVTHSLDGLEHALDQRFDRSQCYRAARRFHVESELQAMLEASRRALLGGDCDGIAAGAG
jgi:glycosyltransferase involved in cell wall biosynthesis